MYPDRSYPYYKANIFSACQDSGVANLKPSRTRLDARANTNAREQGHFANIVQNAELKSQQVNNAGLGLGLAAFAALILFGSRE